MLVTGAGGFLGAHVVAQCDAQACRCFAGTRHPESWRLGGLGVGGKVQTVNLDLHDRDCIRAAIDPIKPDVIINCAAYGVDPSQRDSSVAFLTNVAGALDLLDVASELGVRRFIQIGSCSEYGHKDHPIREEESLNPTGIYGATKAAATIVLRQRARDLGIAFCTLRVFGLWGPLEANYRLFPQILDACERRVPLSLTGCKQIRDYTFVVDIARRIVNIGLLANFPNDEVINLASGNPVVLRDLVLSVAEVFDGAEFMHFGDLPYRENEMWRLEADVAKQQDLLGRTDCTFLEFGLKQMLTVGKSKFSS